MKKLLISSLLLLALVGCAGRNNEEMSSQAVTQKQTQSVTQRQTEKATEELTEKATEESTEKPTEKVTEKYTEPATIPEVNFKAMDEEKGAYWLINKIKSLGTAGGNYVSSFGTTTYTLIAAYIAANPNSRFDASFKTVLSKSKEIYNVELQLKKLDDKYDYPIAKMYEYSLQSEVKTFDVEAKFTESYASGILGWLDKQYDSLKNVGKRTTYYAAAADGSKVMVRPEQKLGDAGKCSIYATCVDTMVVTVDGFEKKYPVYYEISPELKASIESDYNDSLKNIELFDSKKAELNTLLNNIN